MATSKAYKEGVKEAKTGKSGSKAHEKKESKTFKKQEYAGESSIKNAKKKK